MSNENKLSDELKLSQMMDGEWLQLNPSECVASLCADEELRGRWMRYHLIRDSIKKEPVTSDPALASRICAAIREEPEYSNIRPFNGAVSRPADPVSIEQQHDEQVVQASPAASNVSALSVNKPSWINTAVTGFALAASVAAVTVVGLNLYQQQAPSGVPAVAVIDSGINTGESGSIQVQGSQQASVVTTENSVQAVSSDNFVSQGDGANLPVVEFVANTGSYWMSPVSSSRVYDEERLNRMLSRHIESSPTASREGLLPYSRLVGYQEESEQGR